MAAPDGLLIVDKDSGWTSHDVVARIRRLAGTRKVGHAGTLDPMATGVLVLGIGRATRLLGFLALSTKGYDATVRLGQTTLTDDAEGEVLQARDASGLGGGVIEAAVARQRGDIEQVPSAVSAVKVKGERAYNRVRAGEDVVLPPRAVHIARFDVLQTRRDGQVVDLDVQVECSSGTYVRALARDVGAELGVGGHLTRLRRTRVGPHRIDQARTLETLAGLEPDALPVVPIDVAARLHFGWYVVADIDVSAVRNGRPLDVTLRQPAGLAKVALDEVVGSGGRHEPGQDQVLPADEAPEPQGASPAGSGTGSDDQPVVSAYRPGERGAGPADAPVAVLAPGGGFLALYDQHGSVARAVAVFAPAP